MSSSLQQLYPGLQARPEVSDGELTNSIAAKAANSVEVKTRFFAASAPTLIEIARGLAYCFRRGGRLFTMGNGGSASDAAHVAVEFNHPVTVGRPALPAEHLGHDTQFMSAVANDVGFDQVFARQISSLGRSGDALLGLSTSGNSKNLLAAFAAAKRRGILTIGFSGHDGGQMKTAVDHCLVVDSDSVHRIQESHVAAYHVLWDLVHTLLAQERGGEQ
ncbi:MAG: SIS domain-containing protein [Myxococcota bacterium]